MIQFIVKDKKTNKVKELKDISTFSEEDFEKFDVYSTSKVSGDDFEKFKKELQVRALQEQSKQMLEQQQLIQQQLLKLTGGAPQKVVPVSNPSVAPSTVNTLSEIPEGAETAIMNTRTNALFTKNELWDEYGKFKSVLEQKIPEVEMVEYDPIKGFTVIVTERVPNIPKVLPLGIPVTQRIER